MFENFDASKILNCYETKLNAGRFEAKPRKMHGFIYFHEGQSVYSFAKKTIEVQGGWFLYLPEGESYGIRHDRDCVVSVIDAHFYQSEKQEPFAVKAPFVLDSAFSGAVKAFGAKKIGYEASVKSYIYKIISALQASETGYLPTTKAVKIKPALDYINQYYFDHDLTLDSVVATCEYGKRYFSDEFRRATGVSPGQYLIDVRIENAKKMLQSTTDSVKDVAFRCGFKNEYYFSNVFRKKTGESPRDYRKTHRNV